MKGPAIPFHRSQWDRDVTTHRAADEHACRRSKTLHTPCVKFRLLYRSYSFFLRSCVTVAHKFLQRCYTLTTHKGKPFTPATRAHTDTTVNTNSCGLEVLPSLGRPRLPSLHHGTITVRSRQGGGGPGSRRKRAWRRKPGPPSGPGLTVRSPPPHGPPPHGLRKSARDQPRDGLAGRLVTLSGAGSLTPAGAPKPATARPVLGLANLSGWAEADPPSPPLALALAAEADARLLANLSGWADPPRPPGGRDGMGGGGRRRHDTRSLRRALRVHSELSVAPVKDKHAPEKAKRRASFFEPLLVRADLLSCTAQSVRGCFSTLQPRRRHDRPRQTASSQRPINSGLACVPLRRLRGEGDQPPGCRHARGTGSGFDAQDPPG